MTPEDRREIPANRRRAWFLALGADFVQIVLVPWFAAGAWSPATDVLDLVVAFLMIRVLGWHPAFLPTFVAELIPGLDLFPTWTVAVWFVTRKSRDRPLPP